MAKTKLPEPIENARHCPMIGQGCIGDACAWWVSMWGVDDKGKTHLDEECSIPWLVQLGREQLIESTRVSASYDKAATHAARLTNVIAEISPSQQ